MECSGIQYLRGAPEALQQLSVLIMKSAHIGPLSAKTPQVETANGPEHPVCRGVLSLLALTPAMGSYTGSVASAAKPSHCKDRPEHRQSP